MRIFVEIRGGICVGVYAEEERGGDSIHSHVICDWDNDNEEPSENCKYLVKHFNEMTPIMEIEI